MDIHEILDWLDREQKAELALLLHRELNVPDLKRAGRETGDDRPVHCPHCEGADIYGHGSYKGRRRYKCKTCRKTFNDLTGTAVDGIKKLEQFQEYLLLVVESVTIRKAAKKIGVNVKTIFDWRHKLLSSMEALNGTGFTGIVECDDKQLDINEKGQRAGAPYLCRVPSTRKGQVLPCPARQLPGQPLRTVGQKVLRGVDEVSAGLPQLVRVPAKGEEIEFTGPGTCKVRGKQHRCDQGLRIYRAEI